MALDPKILKQKRLYREAKIAAGERRISVYIPNELHQVIRDEQFEKAYANVGVALTEILKEWQAFKAKSDIQSPDIEQ